MFLQLDAILLIRLSATCCDSFMTVGSAKLCTTAKIMCNSCRYCQPETLMIQSYLPAFPIVIPFP